MGPCPLWAQCSAPSRKTPGTTKLSKGSCQRHAQSAMREARTATPGAGVVPNLTALFHHQGAAGFFRFVIHTLAEKFHDLVLNLFAAGTPPAGAGDLFHTTAQAAEPKHPGRLPQTVV